MRVGVITWLHESNTFLPIPTTLDHFRQGALTTGVGVRKAFEGTPHEVGGFFEGLDAAGLEAVPVFAARAVPYGTITAETFTTLLDMLLTEVDRTGKLDGWLVAPHGATVAENARDTDGIWLAKLREKVGPDVPIISTIDPHANLSPLMVASTNAIIAYRTNPHIDQRQRGLEAADLMARTLRGEVRPVQAACFPPMLINIERQCTSEEPCAQLSRDVDAVRQFPGIVGASLVLGFPYADVEEMGAAMLVIADGDKALAQKHANELGRKMWDLREPLAGHFLTPAEAVELAGKSPGPVCLLDMGDNVGGGSPADATWLAHELRRQAVLPSLIALHDPESVQAAHAAGTGQQVKLSMGGRSGELHGPPLETTVSVGYCGPGLFREPEARHGGWSAFDQGPIAIVTTEDGLTVLLTSVRTPPFSLHQLTDFGIDPTAYRVLVAKGVNAPLAAYRPVCPTIIRANTPGVTMADVTGLTFEHRRRPMFPFEREAAWQTGG